jgi:hypothetical protein
MIPFSAPKPEKKQEGEEDRIKVRPAERKENVLTEPYREIQDHSHHGSRDRSEAASSDWRCRTRSTSGARTIMKRKHGRKVDQVVMAAPSVAATSGGRSPGFCQAPMKPTNWSTMMSGPESFPPEPGRPSFVRCSANDNGRVPVARVGKDGVSSSESNQRCLAEEHPLFNEYIVPPAADSGNDNWRHP